MDVRDAEARVWSAVGVEAVEHRLALPRLGIAVKVTEVGQGRPAVFVHGGTVAGATWADLAATLPGVRCLLVDRPGCGQSEPLRDRGLDGFLDSADHLVADVLDALELESAAVVATSLGGFHGMRAAVTHPDRVERLALVGWVLGTPGTPPPVWMRLTMVKPIARLAGVMPVSVRSVKAMMRRAGLGRAIDEGRGREEVFEWLAALFAQTDTLRNEIVDAPPLMSLRGGWDDRLIHSDETLASVRAPTCIVYGDEDPFGTVATTRDLGRRIPDAEVHVIPRAGHAPWLDAPDEVARVLLDFLLDRGDS